ncbi:DUF4301 family protein [Spirosoma utsteinense]|uniref:DUF4301 domain-containing protein n=1 Tax=Spirosoma utsteinense TaxID=2585773 RepID=A0ABR6W0N4_9BACT|nr:DUF4301 family protein [Spirosoma utsteinense]MBC3783709.1 hypothetical protein [Spirosoma utsteinense]MBC3790148.1 hypothetical protein [Spirosoma utsteinense]
MQFTEQDQDQILAQGISPETIDQQIHHFVQGFPYLNVIKAATIGDGIVRISDDQLANYIHRFDQAAHERDLVKFVPASGAATRMFKSLFAALDGKQDKSTDEVFTRLTDFAFYGDLKAAMAAKGADLDAAVAANDRTAVLRFLLTDEGLDYGSLPKGLLKFHRYLDGPRTPVEEHLVEGAAYANSDGTVRIHFTVSPEHRSRFEALIEHEKGDYEAWLGVNFDISFSEQKKSTDTISVDMTNEPFRNTDGTLLFRPAGHGALIENLNDIDADLVFIKNIDNVVPDAIKETTVTYKKVLATVLLDAQQQIARLQSLLEGSDEVSDGYLSEADELLRRTLFTLPPDGFETLAKAEKLAYFRQKLNRPVRACGMVQNVGEPGGGPFWARNQDGSVSLQVVESAQIDLTNPAQKAIFDEATHFNPVDLVCGLKDHHGRKYDLPAFRDPQTGFITAKSKDGKDLKAQELPGLWNGAMADWNTIFVEVPLITFNPVKTVNDLLRKEHQPEEE